jgi:hypothetical protein
LDEDWYWRSLRGALAAIAPLLRPDGRLVYIFADDDPVILEAIALATAGAGYELVGWGALPPGEARFAWRKGTPPDRTSVEADPFSRRVAERVVKASTDVVRARGEPVIWSTLHAAIYADLAHNGLLAGAAMLSDEVAEPLSWLADIIRSALDGAPLRQVFPSSAENAKGGPEEPVWWLDRPSEREVAVLLSDRVELAVAEILRDLLAVNEGELFRRVCSRFPGSQTPDASLIRLCLFSYGDEHAPGYWRLRSEDDLDARVAETDAVITDLSSLGNRLGFDVELGIPRAGEWAVRWQDETGHTPYVFAVRTTAVLGEILFAPSSLSFLHPHSTATPEQVSVAIEPDITPCLTLPGGRAVLVGYKLRHDPRLRQQVARYGWQFLKFRHLRRLLREEADKQLDRYAFKAALGLDPIVEQEEAQLSLW